MGAVIGRLIPFAVILGVWWYFNHAMDKLEGQQNKLKKSPFWGKLFFLYGWTIGVRKFGTFVRYIITGGVLFFVLRWFFIATSSTVP